MNQSGFHVIHVRVEHCGTVEVLYHWDFKQRGDFTSKTNNLGTSEAILLDPVL